MKKKQSYASVCTQTQTQSEDSVVAILLGMDSFRAIRTGSDSALRDDMSLSYTPPPLVSTAVAPPATHSAPGVGAGAPPMPMSVAMGMPVSSMPVSSMPVSVSVPEPRSTFEAMAMEYLAGQGQGRGHQGRVQQPKGKGNGKVRNEKEKKDGDEAAVALLLAGIVQKGGRQEEGDKEEHFQPLHLSSSSSTPSVSSSSSSSWPVTATASTFSPRAMSAAEGMQNLRHVV
jgi:hypothetical protein